MALSEENGGIGATMLVGPTGYPMMYQGGGGFGNGGFGGDWGWIILLLLLAGGGWGNGFGGGFGGNNDLYPWMNQSNQVNNGFRDQMINDNITGIRSDLGDISTQLCNGFNGTQMSILQSVNGLQSQFAQCCCDNRVATIQTQNVVSSEGAATRLAIQNQTQSILDKLCQLELDGYKRENDSLRSELTQANLAASQIAQTAQIVDQTYNRLSSCPVGTTPVYGNQPIFTCPVNVANNGCGCGCGG